MPYIAALLFFGEPTRPKDKAHNAKNLDTSKTYQSSICISPSRFTELPDV